MRTLHHDLPVGVELNRQGAPVEAYINQLPWSDRLRRGVWNVVQTLLRLTPESFGNMVRCFVLRCFGAVLGRGCRISRSAVIHAPWNMVLGDYCCLAPGVDFYNVGTITLGDKVTISQRAFLCTASHDITHLNRPLVVGQIRIEAHAWICAEAIVMPDRKVGTGAVVAAGAVVVTDVPPWTIVGGNPAKPIGVRHIENDQVSPHVEVTDEVATR